MRNPALWQRRRRCRWRTRGSRRGNLCRVLLRLLCLLSRLLCLLLLLWILSLAISNSTLRRRPRARLLPRVISKGRMALRRGRGRRRGRRSDSRVSLVGNSRMTSDSSSRSSSRYTRCDARCGSTWLLIWIPISSTRARDTRISRWRLIADAHPIHIMLQRIRVDSGLLVQRDRLRMLSLWCRSSILGRMLRRRATILTRMLLHLRLANLPSTNHLSPLINCGRTMRLRARQFCRRPRPLRLLWTKSRLLPNILFSSPLGRRALRLQTRQRPGPRNPRSRIPGLNIRARLLTGTYDRRLRRWWRSTLCAGRRRRRR